MTISFLQVFQLRKTELLLLIVIKLLTANLCDARCSRRNNDLLQTIDSSDKRYDAYKRVVEYFRYSMNFSADPCSHFYEYACGNYQKQRSFGVLRENNHLITAKQLENNQYRSSNTPKPLQQTVWFYNKCKNARANYPAYIKDGKGIREVMDSFSNSTGLKFSMITTQNFNPPQNLTPKVLAYALGVLSRKGVDTLIKPTVNTNWKNSKVYKFYLDQNELHYSKGYYVPKVWNLIKDTHTKDVMELFNRYADVLNITLEQDALRNDVLKLFDLETRLANEYSTNDSDRRRNITRMFTAYSTEKNYTFIDFPTYFAALSEGWKDLSDYFNNNNLSWYLMEADQLSGLDRGFAGNQFDEATISNYLFYRLLDAYKDYLPNFKTTTRLAENFELGSEKLHHLNGLSPVDVIYDDVRTQCAHETLNSLPYAHARFFMDGLLPIGKSKMKAKNGIKKIFQRIVKSFKEMLHKLSWFDDKTLKGAMGKIFGLNRNYAYPDFIVNDEQLALYYSDLNITEDDTYGEMRQKIRNFNFMMKYKVLLNDTAVDRSDFNGSPSITSAWYTPELNSVSFPIGILQPPFFDLQWPASMNYGGIGTIAGHELTHGFDDHGIQWDENGELNNWMSDSAKRNFSEMADCVIREYNNFCPSNDFGVSSECLDGYTTQGENIADNGGIRAAWNGYKDHVKEFGADPQIPDDILGKITHDQLFFLNFAQIWCEKDSLEGNMHTQIWSEPHSPSRYRVLGTIQNFPEFRTAFDCPVGSEYVPKEYCSVWVPKN